MQKRLELRLLKEYFDKISNKFIKILINLKIIFIMNKKRKYKSEKNKNNIEKTK